MKPGIYNGMPMAEYMRLPAFSSSRAHTLLTYSPFHARYMPSREPSDASDNGTAIHDVLLEGVDRIAEIAAEDWRTKAAKEARDAARAEGKIPLLASRAATVKEAVGAAKEFVGRSELAGIFQRGKPEVTFVWDDGGLLCKARPDWLTDEHDILLHVKTTQGSAEPNSWIRNQLTNCGYDVACAFYERGLYASYTPGSGKNAPLSVFLVIEANAPYGCSLVALDPAMADLADSKARRAIKTWAECKRTKKYPSYPTQICYAEPKPWDLAAEQESASDEVFDVLQAKEGLQA